MRQFISLSLVCAALGVSAVAQQPAAPGPLTAIRAGRLLDPEAGRVLTNQIILIEGTRIRDVGPNVAIPAGAQTIDLSAMTVLPGLVDAHNHLALTYKPEPESNIYYYTYVA
jgi:imidazolonepropionase-like amidohydrolase